MSTTIFDNNLLRKENESMFIPGNTVELLHSAISNFMPLYSTGGNGLPVAQRTLPSVHSNRSAGLASWRLVGLLRGKIIGRSTCFAISFTTSLVNAPGFVDVPIRTCGFTSFTTLNRSPCSLPSHSLSSLA